MRKFECKKCLNNCIVLANDYYLPKTCCYDFGYKPDWHEVVDSAENEQFGNSEQLPSNPRKLPDWVKVGEWFYDVVLREYFCFKKEDDWSWYIENIESGRIKKAFKRPFNADEMRALVGEVVEHKNNLHLVTNYLEDSTDNTPYVCVGTNWREAKGLIEHGYTIDGKPCFKLEHLNENGEWVE